MTRQQIVFGDGFIKPLAPFIIVGENFGPRRHKKYDGIKGTDIGTGLHFGGDRQPEPLEVSHVVMKTPVEKHRSCLTRGCIVTGEGKGDRRCHKCGLVQPGERTTTYCRLLPDNCASRLWHRSVAFLRQACD